MRRFAARTAEITGKILWGFRVCLTFHKVELNSAMSVSFFSVALWTKFHKEWVSMMYFHPSSNERTSLFNFNGIFSKLPKMNWCWWVTKWKKKRMYPTLRIWQEKKKSCFPVILRGCRVIHPVISWIFKAHNWKSPKKLQIGLWQIVVSAEGLRWNLFFFFMIALHCKCKKITHLSF